MATVLPTAQDAKPWLSITYGQHREWGLFSTSAKPIICRPYPAASIECNQHASDGLAAGFSCANAWGDFPVFVGELEKSEQETKSVAQTGITARRGGSSASNTIYGRNLRPVRVHTNQVQKKMTDVSLAAAFIAGLLSFLSPCVLPLVPGYISMLSGIGMEQLRQGQQPRGGLFASALSFVVGFSVVFISFGASASAVGTFLLKNRGMLAPVAGALILLFGLHLVGALVKLTFRTGIILGALLVVLGIASVLHHGPLFFGLGWVHFFSLSLIGFFGPALAKWLNRDVHLRSTSTKPGLLSGFFLGFAFAFGWTPCIGPILATVLALAAASDTIARGVLLLSVYSAGLAVPFLLTALLIGQFLKFYQRFRKYLHAVELLSGALLLFVGGLVFVNKLTWLAGKLSFLNDAVLWLEKVLTGVK
jgi:cytochrome c-type biogenesis protein